MLRVTIMQNYGRAGGGSEQLRLLIIFRCPPASRRQVCREGENVGISAQKNIDKIMKSIESYFFCCIREGVGDSVCVTINKTD